MIVRIVVGCVLCLALFRVDLVRVCVYRLCGISCLVCVVVSWFGVFSLICVLVGFAVTLMIVLCSTFVFCSCGVLLRFYLGLIVIAMIC